MDDKPCAWCEGASETKKQRECARERRASVEHREWFRVWHMQSRRVMTFKFTDHCVSLHARESERGSIQLAVSRHWETNSKIVLSMNFIKIICFSLILVTFKRTAFRLVKKAQLFILFNSCIWQLRLSRDRRAFHRLTSLSDSCVQRSISFFLL